MAEVGVLDLTINAKDTSNAAGSIRELADALRSMDGALSDKSTNNLVTMSSELLLIKGAVKGGIKLSPISDQIAELATKINAYIGKSVLNKINQLSEALKGLQGLGKVTINIRDNGGSRKIKENLDEAKTSSSELGQNFASASEQIDSAENHVENIYHAMERVNEIVQNTTWTAGGMADAFSNAFKAWNNLRASMSLGGQNIAKLDAGSGSQHETGWAYYNPFGETSETGWTEWKNGAIEVEGTVSDATESITGYLENTQLALRETAQEAQTTSDAFYEALQENQRLADESEEIRKAQEEKFYSSSQKRVYTVGETNSMADNLTELDLLKAKLQEAQVQYNKFVNELGAGSAKAVKAGLEVSNLRDKIWEYKQSVESAKSTRVDELLGASDIELKTMQISSMKDALMEGVESGRLSEQQAIKLASAISKAESQLEKMKETEEETTGITSGLRGAFEELKDRFNHLGIKKLYDQFIRMVKLRAIRYVIREISSAFSEGVENVYNYSKAVGSSFYSSMDSATSVLNQFKNSIAAAATPLIESLIPYLQIAVNWLINIINYINQFIALLSGATTWTRALLTQATAFGDVEDSASGASAAVKDLLADWDELNIIQSDSSSGSGTGTDAMTDYLNMFEQVAEFNSTIQNMVDKLKDSFDTLKTLAILIGTTLLAWKLSNFFMDKVSWLSEVFSFIAGLGLLTISVGLGYDAAYDAGSSGKWTAAGIAEEIVSVFLGGLGGYMISHNAYGIIAGVSISLIASLVGYLKGLRNREDMLKWGDTSLTPEDVHDYVVGLFEFDIEAKINILDAVLLDQQEARSKLNEKVMAFNDSLVKIRIGVDGSPQGIEDAAETARNVIDQINENLQTSEKNLEILTKIVPTNDYGEDDEKSALLESVKIADKQLSDYFKDLGEQIAGWIDEGEKNGWKNNEADMAIELMRHQQSILDQAEQNKTTRDFQVESELNISSMTRDTANDVLNKEIELINEYTSKMEEAYNNQIKELYYYADLARAAGLKDENGNPLSDYYEAMAESLMEDVKSGKIYDEITPAIELMKQQWIEQLQSVYGPDLAREVNEQTQSRYVWDDWFGWGNFLDQGIKSAFGSGNTEDAAKYIEDSLWSVFAVIDTTGITKKASELFGFSIVDLLDNESLGKVISSVYNATNGDSDAAVKILQALGIDSEKIAEGIKTAIENGAENASSDLNEELQKGIDEASPTIDLRNVTFITPDGEKQTLLDPSQITFGIGIPRVNVDTSNTEFDIDKKEFSQELADEVNSALMISGSWLDVEGLQYLAENLNLSLQDLLDMVSGDLPEDTLANLRELVDIINETRGTNYTIPALETSKIEESTNNAASAFESMRDRIRSALNSLNGITWSMNLFGNSTSGGITVSMPTIQTAATGGFVKSGDLVMADENGQFEMMGKMGNQPVVANNQQIISGISQGVSGANAEVVSAINSLITTVQKQNNKSFEFKWNGSTLGYAVSKGMGSLNKVTG